MGTGLSMPVSATVIHYAKGSSVGYHKDPSAYVSIASLTLEGQGEMKVWRRPERSCAYALTPAHAVCLDPDDCLLAKHKVTSVDGGHRVGLVIRFV